MSEKPRPILAAEDEHLAEELLESVSQPAYFAKELFPNSNLATWQGNTPIAQKLLQSYAEYARVIETRYIER